MNTQEGYLYRRINKIMRDRQFNDQSFQNLEYYYLSLMYSLQEIYRSPPNENFTLFRGFKIDENKIKHYKGMKADNLIILYEFLSTSENQKVAERFYKNPAPAGFNNCLMKINIPSNHEIKLAFLKELSEFKDEEEILLPSGTILQFISIITINNIINLNFSLVASNMHGLSIFISYTTL